MKTFLSLVFVIAALFSYIILSTSFGINQKYPIIHYILAIAALAYMMRLIVKEYTHFRLAANIIGWIAFGLFLWWTLSFSKYGPQPTIQAGVNPGVQNLMLRDSGSMPFDLGAELAAQKYTLLVFYRGYW